MPKPRTPRPAQPSPAARSTLAKTLVRSCAELMSSPRLEVVFPRILQVASRVFPSDASALWRRENKMWKIGLSQGLSERYLESSPLGQNRDSGAFHDPILAEDVRKLPLVAHRMAGYEAEGIRAFIAAPIFVRQELRGTLTLYFRKPRRFSSEDSEILAAVADLAAAAIGTAELYETQTRLHAEAAEARARYKFLADTSAVLASSLDAHFILGELARSVVPHIADWCAIDILAENGELDRLAVAHVHPEKMRLAREFQKRYPVDLNSATGLAKVLRTGQSEMYPVITDEMINRASTDPERTRILKELGLRSALMVAMNARGRILGALTLGQAESRRRFEKQDIALAQDIANRAALYLDNSRLMAQKSTG